MHRLVYAPSKCTRLFLGIILVVSTRLLMKLIEHVCLIGFTQ